MTESFSRIVVVGERVSWYNVRMNNIQLTDEQLTIHSNSIVIGQAFALIWRDNNNATATKVFLLEKYRELRRQLPKMPCGKYWGNHDGSKKIAWRVTQGEIY